MGISKLCNVGFVAVVLTSMVHAAQESRGNFFFQDSGFATNKTIELDYGNNHPMDQRSRLRKRGLQQIDGVYRLDVNYSSSPTDDDNDKGLQPIRIHFVTDLIEKRRGESTEMDDFIDRLINQDLPAAADKWAKHLYVTPVQSDIQVQSTDCHGLFGEQAPVTSISGADLVVIVSLRRFLWNDQGTRDRVCRDGELAMASACTLDQYDRPVVGFINWCFQDSSSQSTTASLQQAFTPHLGFQPEQLRVEYTGVAVHELGHVLGFGEWLFKYYRRPDGTPRTNRPFQEKEFICSDGATRFGHFPSRNTVYPLQDDGTTTFMFATPRVKKVVQNTLNCQKMIGAPLQAGDGCFGSHWAERIFFGEVMSPAISIASENILSALSLALMEDSGWYKVDYRDVETPVFGLGAGCDFATKKCIVDDKVPSWGQGMFCDSPIRFDSDEVSQESVDSVGCDPSHKSWTVCDLWDESTAPEIFTESFPKTPIRYFTDQSLFSIFHFTESCPIPVRSIGVDCTQEENPYTPLYDGEELGSMSRCVHASYGHGSNKVIRPACLPMRCDEDSRKIVVSIGGQEHVCLEDGQTFLSPLEQSTAFICPKLVAICPQFASCPGSCSGRGSCNFDSPGGPICQCNEGARNNEGCFPWIGPNHETPVPTTVPSLSPFAVGDDDDDDDDSLSSSHNYEPSFVDADKEDTTSSTPTWPCSTMTAAFSLMLLCILLF